MRKYKIFWSLPHAYSNISSPYAPQVCGAFTSKLKYGKAIGAGSHFTYRFVYEGERYPMMTKIALLNPETLFVTKDPNKMFWNTELDEPIQYFTYDQETKQWTERVYSGCTLENNNMKQGKRTDYKNAVTVLIKSGEKLLVFNPFDLDPYFEAHYKRGWKSTDDKALEYMLSSIRQKVTVLSMTTPKSVVFIDLPLADKAKRELRLYLGDNVVFSPEEFVKRLTQNSTKDKEDE